MVPYIAVQRKNLLVRTRAANGVAHVIQARQYNIYCNKEALGDVGINSIARFARGCFDFLSAHSLFPTSLKKGGRPAALSLPYRCDTVSYTVPYRGEEKVIKNRHRKRGRRKRQNKAEVAPGVKLETF